MRKILIIGMTDSIHLARWLARFRDRNLDFVIFGVRKRIRIHPELKQLLEGSFASTYRIVASKEDIRQSALSGASLPSPFVRNRLARITIMFFRSRSFHRHIKASEFDYIHIHEMQHAGYIFAFASKKIPKSVKVILHNWGSDISFYQKYKFDRFMIRYLLRKVQFYSAECHRDFELAIKYGFNGNFLPPFPTSFIYNSKLAESSMKLTLSERRQLTVKCYGGDIGLGGSVINVVREFLRDNQECEVLLYYVTPDLYKKSKELLEDFPSRVRVWKSKENHTNSELMEEFLQSRIYIGFSLGDGLSTSLLEAINCGTFGIQSLTACANELTNDGIAIGITSVNPTDLFQTLQKFWIQPDYLSQSTLTNLEVLEQKFNVDLMTTRMRNFYE